MKNRYILLKEEQLPVTKYEPLLEVCLCEGILLSLRQKGLLSETEYKSARMNALRKMSERQK